MIFRSHVLGLWRRHAHPKGIAGATALAGLLVGWSVLPRATEDCEEPLQLRLGKQLVPLDANVQANALTAMRSQLRRPFELLDKFGSTARSHSVSAAQLGIEIDRTRLTQLLADARNPQSLTRQLRTWHRLTPGGEPQSLKMPLRLNPQQAHILLLALKKQLDQPPRDARLNPNGGLPLAERVGRLLDLDASLWAIEQAVENGQQKAGLVFHRTVPARLSSELELVVQTTTLGRFSTPYDESRKAQARTFNLQLAASRLNGTVLLPGDIFDFNAVVGPRDEANGYQVASVIAQGEVVDGIGGGTCQISGTLHAAALFAGLSIVERTPHTRPSSYIKLGFDATVVYPTINLRIANPYDFPVVLHETVNDGKVNVRILGPRRPHRITIIRKIDEGTPFERLERPDPNLPDGIRVLAQQGVPGLTLHRYRVVESGAHSIREKIVDRYPPTAEVVRVGTGEPNSARQVATFSAGREYLPDELLVLSQQANPSAPLLISRRPGRYGRPGWTAQLRMQSL